MTNYFGKARLKKIFYCYISDRLELVKKIRNIAKECGSWIYEYKKCRGSEWFECSCDGYIFKIWADGKNTKVISMDEFHYNEKSEEY